MANTKGDNEPVQQPKTISCLYLSYTPCHFTFNGTDYLLYNNETYTLPDCDYVRSLIGQGKLVEK